MGGSRAQVSRPVHSEKPARSKAPCARPPSNAGRKKAPRGGGALRQIHIVGLLNPTAERQRWAETIPRTEQAQANGIFSEVSPDGKRSVVRKALYFANPRHHPQSNGRSCRGTKAAIFTCSTTSLLAQPAQSRVPFSNPGPSHESLL